MSSVRGIDISVAIKEQSDLFTAVPDTNLVSGDFLGFDNESMAGNRKVVKSKAIKKASMKTRSASANGTIGVDGAIEFTASQLILDKILPLATHLVVSTDVNQPLQNVVDLASPAEKTAKIARKRYTLIESGRLVPFTTFIGFGGGTASEGNYTRVFKGCKVASLDISAKVDSFVTLNVGIAGITKKIQDGARTAVYPAADVEFAYFFDGASVKLKTGNMATLGELPVESFDLQLNHGLNTNSYRLGSAERYALDEGLTSVTGTFGVQAGVDSISGARMNQASGLTNDRAFLERLNLEAKYASLQVRFVDWTRTIVETQTDVASTTTVIKLVTATVSVSQGDQIEIGGTRVRVLSVDTATKTITLDAPLSVAPAAGLDLVIASHLRISLPFVRIEEPDFHAKDESVIMGTAKFEGFDNIVFDHVCKLG